MDPLSALPLTVVDALIGGRAGPEHVARLQRRRLADLVRHARTASPFFRHAYRGLPADVGDPLVLPPVDKRTLMANFDEWVTDPAVTLEAIRRDFLSDLSLVGRPYLGRYHVMTTSGSTGEPAVLLHDRGSWHVLHVLARTRPHVLAGKGDAVQLPSRGVRVAALYATGGHFGGVVLIEAARRLSPVIARRTRVFSVLRPVDELVRELNEFRPTMMGGYPSAMVLLAAEQRAGRLRIAPVRVIRAGELLTAAMRADIRTTFDCVVSEGYAATEAPALSLQCAEGRFHVNADWYLLEPVDADFRPVPAGEASSTVLVTNLANRVQPIIRYDLGDRVTFHAERCPCGSPLPTVSVEGRTNDVLTFEDDQRAPVSLALGTVIEETPGVHRFQAIGAGPSSLTVRLETVPGTSVESVWPDVEQRIEGFLTAHGIAYVHIELSPEPPNPDPRSGKLRQVIRG
jgi:phenylacetate-coenzyme A ligase PaaK-like adenylate-forming protein